MQTGEHPFYSGGVNHGNQKAAQTTATETTANAQDAVLTAARAGLCELSTTPRCTMNLHAGEVVTLAMATVKGKPVTRATGWTQSDLREG